MLESQVCNLHVDQVFLVKHRCIVYILLMRCVVLIQLSLIFTTSIFSTLWTVLRQKMKNKTKLMYDNLENNAVLLRTSQRIIRVWTQSTCQELKMVQLKGGWLICFVEHSVGVLD